MITGIRTSNILLIPPKFTILAVCVTTHLLLTSCATTPDPANDPDAAASAFGNQLGAIRYEVKTGDNLVLIAAEVTLQRENWRRIADFNRINNPATLKVGQTIWIPNDLIPLDTNETDTRSIAGHPDAVVNSVKLPSSIKPVN